MNREIKFRAQKSNNNEIVYFDLKYFLENDEDKMPDAMQYVLKNIKQFTGLLDKNGTEIYEGDILKTLNNIVFVFFGKHLSYVTMLGKKDTIETNGWLVKNAKAHIDVLDESFCNGEVIGNICENPELLDGSVA